MNVLARCALALAIAVLGPPSPGVAQTPPAAAMISACRFANGVTIAPCRVTYRAFGRLNAAKDNVVLVPTWLLGRSEDWIGFLGPRGIVDTTRHYTIVVDALGDGHSQSPSNTPVFQRRGFDALTIGDMVESQYRLLTERFGLTRIHGVVGASMGGMQALEWAVRYPTFASHIVSIIGTPRIGAFDRVLWSTLRMEIDNGVRTGVPIDSTWLQLARVEALTMRTPRGINQVSPDSMAREVAASAKGYRTAWPLQDYRAALGAMVRHDVSTPYGGSLATAAARVRAKVLLVYSWDDHMVTADAGAQWGPLVRADTVSISSSCGHLIFLCETQRVGDAVRTFLAQ